MDDGLFLLLAVGVGYAVHWGLKVLDRALWGYRIKKNGRGR